jgi:hypothetical protein
MAARMSNKEATIMELKTSMTVKFTTDDPPRIANCSDTLELLYILIKADGVVNGFIALQALRDAVERAII